MGDNCKSPSWGYNKQDKERWRKEWLHSLNMGRGKRFKRSK